MKKALRIGQMFQRLKGYDDIEGLLSQWQIERIRASIGSYWSQLLSIAQRWQRNIQTEDFLRVPASQYICAIACAAGDFQHIAFCDVLLRKEITSQVIKILDSPKL